MLKQAAQDLGVEVNTLVLGYLMQGHGFQVIPIVGIKSKKEMEIAAAAADCHLPQEVVEAAPLSFASIKYHREVPMGQSVQVFYAPSGNGWYVLGRREEHAAFECYLEFGSSVTESLQK